MQLLLATQALCTLAMVGVIWFVQLVHYPLMARTGGIEFRSFQAEHMRRTTWVVGPLMLGEAAGAVVLLVLSEGPTERWVAGAGLFLVGVLWLTTATVQVPLHRKLRQGFDADVHRRLVLSNWLRTAMWTVRGMLILLLITG